MMADRPVQGEGGNSADSGFRQVSMTIVGLLVFLCSGASGLIFEIIWIRTAALGLGITIQAVTIVVASFMAGLALGSALLGRFADRTRRCFRLYALLEVGVALSGLAAQKALMNLPSWMALLPTHLGTAGDRALQLALVFVILIVPCTLMGGTLPVLTRALASPSRPSQALGLLYGANTLGAVGAAFLTDWLLVPSLGLSASTFVAAALDLAAAGGIILMAGREEKPPVKPRTLTLFRSRLHIVYALAGLAAMGLQITWTRLMMTFARPSIYVYSVVLTVFLTGIALGSLLAASWSSRLSRPRDVLVFVLSLIPVTTLASMLWITPVNALLTSPAVDSWFNAAAGPVDNAVRSSMLLNALRSIGLFGLPTLLMGIAFPLAGRLATDGHDDLGAPLGELYASNTVGAIIGTFATGLWILPALGVQATILAMSWVGIASASLLSWKTGVSRVAMGGLAMAAALCAGAAFLPATTLLDRIYLPLWSSHWGVDQKRLMFFADDSYGTVAVLDAPTGPQLLVNSTRMMGVPPEGQRYAQLMGHLPAFLHPDPHKALVICFGTGMTTGALSVHPELQEITCVELSPSVLAAAGCFTKWNRDVIHSPKVHFVLADGRNYLLRSKERFDIITFEPPPPTQAGVVSLYDADYYRLCREHLTPQGLVCQWVPLSLLDEPDLKLVLRAFLEVFPNATLWEGSTHNYFMIGSPSPVRVRWADLARGREDKRLAFALADIGMDDPLSLAATFMHGPGFLRDYTAGTPLTTDDRPYLEYSRNWRPHWSLPVRTRNMKELEPSLEGFTRQQVAALERRADSFQALLDYRDMPAFSLNNVPGTLTYLNLARTVLTDVPYDPYGRYILGVTDAQMNELKASGAEQVYALHLLALGRFEEALPMLKKLQKESPCEASLFLWEAWALERSGKNGADARRKGLELLPDAGMRKAAADVLGKPPAR